MSAIEHNHDSEDEHHECHELPCDDLVNTNMETVRYINPKNNQKTLLFVVSGTEKDSGRQVI